MEIIDLREQKNKKEEFSKKPRLTKHTPWDIKKTLRLCAIIFVNILVIAGLVIGSVAISGMNGGVSVAEYFSARSSDFIYLVLALTFVFVVLTFYLFFENRAFVDRLENFEMIFLAMELTYVFCFVFGTYVNFYLRPVIFCAFLILPLTDRRTAVFVNVVTCISMFLIDAYSNVLVTSYDAVASFITGFICGTAGVYLLDKMYSRIQTILRGLLLAVPALICMLVIHQERALDVLGVVCALLSGLLSTVLMVIVLPVFEYIFNRVTTYRLAEMTRHDAPLIRKMIEIAPGTFNHSVVVANIAEACATAIGEDALLARACAYYHDMGKLKQPEYFTENQKGGVNPHNDLTPELSTAIIKSHTKDGYELIKKYHLPNMFADVCLQHHGTMPIMYFFEKAKKFTDGELAVENFVYAGPKPQTKIAAIIMIADSSEAAVRSMAARTRDSVDKLVEKIIDERLRLGQFDECEITMHELSIVRNVIANTLTGVYHERIEYPKINLEYLVKKSKEEEERKRKEEDKQGKDGK